MVSILEELTQGLLGAKRELFNGEKFYCTSYKALYVLSFPTGVISPSVAKHRDFISLNTHWWFLTYNGIFKLLKDTQVLNTAD